MPVVASTIVMALVIAFWWSQKESHDAQANRSLELHADATEREIRTWGKYACPSARTDGASLGAARRNLADALGT
jgi:hypothetical protein